MKLHPQTFTLDDGHGTRLQVCERGATWLSCRVPLADGSPREVLLGHADASRHGVEPGYLGAVIGRWANRIGGARFVVDGLSHELSANEGHNLLHGGGTGFDKRDWSVLEHQPTRLLRLQLVSPAGDQGFPGTLVAQVSYTIEAPGCIRLRFDAECDAACPVNLTSHAYFNLDGAQAQPMPIDGHRFRLRASQVLPVDVALIPLGHLAPVAGSRFDLRELGRLGTREFDHCFVLDEPGSAEPNAEVQAADGRLRLALGTDYPGLQFYTGQLLAQSNDRQGRRHLPRAGFALEPQFLPDSPNQPQWAFGGWLLRPGQRLRRHALYTFTAG